MAGPLRGHAAAGGLGTESTHGTAVSRDRWFRVTELSGHTAQIERTPRQVSQGPDADDGGLPVAFDEGRITTAGLTFTVPAHYDDASVSLWYFALGAVSDAGSGPYTHTFTADGALPSATLETIHGADASGSSRALVHRGCVCSELVFESRPEAGTATIRTTWNARRDGGDTAGGTPTLGPVTLPVTAWQAGSASWNGITLTNTTIRSVQVRIANALAERFGHGDQYAQQPVQEGQREVSVTMEIEYDQAEQSIYDDWLDGSSSNLTLTYTSGTNGIAFTLYAAPVTALEQSGPIRGIVTRTITWTGKRSGSSKGLQVVVTNGNSAYSSNGA